MDRSESATCYGETREQDRGENDVDSIRIEPGDDHRGDDSADEVDKGIPAGKSDGQPNGVLAGR